MRSRRKTRLSRGLTRVQEIWLVHGFRWLKENPFNDPAAERRAWLQHRERIGAKYRLPPGTRAAAWWRHESGVNPASLPAFFVTPTQEIGARLQYRLIDEAEASEIEKRYAILNPALSDSLTDPETIANLRLTAHTLRHLLKDAAIAERWHKWRGRIAASEKYRLLAIALREMVTEDRIEERTTSYEYH